MLPSRSARSASARRAAGGDGAGGAGRAVGGGEEAGGGGWGGSGGGNRRLCDEGLTPAQALHADGVVRAAAADESQDVRVQLVGREAAARADDGVVLDDARPVIAAAGKDRQHRLGKRVRVVVGGHLFREPARARFVAALQQRHRIIRRCWLRRRRRHAALRREMGERRRAARLGIFGGGGGRGGGEPAARGGEGGDRRRGGEPLRRQQLHQRRLELL